MVAALIPGWGGPICKVDGMVTGCRLAFGVLSSGAAVRVSANAPSGVFVKFTNTLNGQATTRWSPLTAIDFGGVGWVGYLPTGAQLGVDGHPDIFSINLKDIGAPGSPNMNFIAVLTELPWAVISGSPQNAYDPRADFRDYAEGLSKNKSIDDCQKLALMIYKAGQVFGGSNPFSDSGRGIIHGLMAGLTEYSYVSVVGREPSDSNYRVGVFTGSHGDPHYGGGFRDSGFILGFQDDSNQVRHFVAYLGTSFDIGENLANRALY